jgi:hypothetical protein
MPPCLIYSDESGSGEDRFEAIGTLSGFGESLEKLKVELSSILSSYNLSHCEYKEVRGGLKLRVAIEFIKAIHKYVLASQVKIMVLVWDKHDSRHTVAKRDNLANTSIMYYRALKCTKRQWRDSTIDSEFYPDELTKLDFVQIIKFLERTKIRDQAMFNTLFGREFTTTFPVIISHNERVSRDEPLIQAIDIITGIVRLSYQEKNEIEKWFTNEGGQLDIFSAQKPIKLSPGKSSKYELISTFNEILKRDKLSVALRTTQGFYSHQPSCGYFFWKYEPQHINDKAPQISSSSAAPF